MPVPVLQFATPAVQVLPAQQGWPTPPQIWQVPEAAAQAVPGVEHEFPEQHGWPVAPQAMQLLFRHSVPLAEQTLPPQQGWLRPPHATQFPFEQTALAPGALLGIRAHRHAMEGNAEAAVADINALGGQGQFDPEALYLASTLLSRAGATEAALALATRAIDHGYACYTQLVERAEWSALRGQSAFEALVERTGAMVARARTLFDEAGGAKVLS